MEGTNLYLLQLGMSCDPGAARAAVYRYDALLQDEYLTGTNTTDYVHQAFFGAILWRPIEALAYEGLSFLPIPRDIFKNQSFPPKITVNGPENHYVEITPFCLKIKCMLIKMT